MMCFLVRFGKEKYMYIKSFYIVLLVPRPPRSAGDYWIRVCLSVCPSTFSYTFYSALDLPHYLEESNKTWHSERTYIVVVHLGIGFTEQRKMCL